MESPRIKALAKEIISEFGKEFPALAKYFDTLLSTVRFLDITENWLEAILVTKTKSIDDLNVFVKRDPCAATFYFFMRDFLIKEVLDTKLNNVLS